MYKYYFTFFSLFLLSCNNTIENQLYETITNSDIPAVVMGKIDKDGKPLTESKDLISLSAKKFSKSSKKGKKPYRNFKRK